MTSGNRLPVDPVILSLIVVNTLVEAVLSANDWGLFGPPGLRRLAYEYGGFWPGLLMDWSPNYPGQPVLMFATYAFLHGGPLHLIVNMVTLWSLGMALIERSGRAGFLAIYVVSAIGGALAYAVLSTTPQPMVGASGALFGLAGAWLAWEWLDRSTLRAELWPILRVVLLLIALNAVMWVSLHGQLAWQTHLGGFIIGWLMALVVNPLPAVEGEDDDEETETDAGTS